MVLSVCVELVILLTSSLLFCGLCLYLSEWKLLWWFVLVLGLLLSVWWGLLCLNDLLKYFVVFIVPSTIQPCGLVYWLKLKAVSLVWHNLFILVLLLGHLLRRVAHNVPFRAYSGGFIGLLSERPMVIHTVKWEECQILWMGPFCWMSPPLLTSDGNFGKSTFLCTVHWCMQICHKPFPHHLRAIWKC